MHIRTSGRTLLDIVGSDHPDLRSAREEAERLVRELIAEKLWSGAAAGRNDIEICGPAGERLELVTLTRVLAMVIPGAVRAVVPR
jgi:hypothetical protein